MNTLKVKRLTSTALLPTRAMHGDAGMDIYSDEDVILHAGEWKVVRSGIAVEIPHGYVGLVHPRSGLAARHGVTILNTPGTVDSGYRGELQVILAKVLSAPDGEKSLHIKRGDRIAQLVIQEVKLPQVEEVFELSESERGVGGFGSTGS